MCHCSTLTNTKYIPSPTLTNIQNTTSLCFDQYHKLFPTERETWVFVYPRRGDLGHLRQDRRSERWGKRQTRVPLSMGNNIFVLHHNASTSANKPDCHHRSCFYCSALQRFTFLPHTRRWQHTECLHNSTLDVTVSLEHRHWTLGFLRVCVCCCWSCHSTDHNKCLAETLEPGKPAFVPAAPLPRQGMINFHKYKW